MSFICFQDLCFQILFYIGLFFARFLGFESKLDDLSNFKLPKPIFHAYASLNIQEAFFSNKLTIDSSLTKRNQPNIKIESAFDNLIKSLLEKVAI